MSESKETSGQTTTSSGSVENQNTANVDSSGGTVSYESHKKLLAEKKKMQERFDELSKKLEDFENQKLQSEGKKDELLKAYEKKVKDAESLLKQKDSMYAQRVINAQLEKEAIARGAVDVETFMELFGKKMTAYNNASDLIESDYTIKQEELKRIADELQKEKAFLFKSGSPNVQPGVPGKTQISKGGVDLSKLSIQDKARLLAQMHSRK